MPEDVSRHHPSAEELGLVASGARRDIRHEPVDRVGADETVLREDLHVLAVSDLDCVTHPVPDLLERLRHLSNGLCHTSHTECERPRVRSGLVTVCQDKKALARIEEEKAAKQTV